MSRGMCWLRRDLRLTDNRTLHRATSRHDEAVVAFVLDSNILARQALKANNRVTFILDSLAELDQKLRSRGSRLLVLHGDPVAEIPRACATLGIDRVYCGRDYDPAAIERDNQVQSSLAEGGVEFEWVKDQVIFEAGQILSKSDSPFRVFTPYSRAWLERFDLLNDLRISPPYLQSLVSDEELEPLSKPMTHESIGFTRREPWLKPGENAAKARVQAFDERIDRYGETRDFPAAEGGSHLSVDLRFGTISIREAFLTAVRSKTPGANKWMLELIWREFYQDILANNPQVVETTFDPLYRNMTWPGSEENFRAWCEGRTGYPIVDAAMRCLNETGWMHNRLRMIVASFLTKDLLVDYRKGEAYFAKLLLDYELASNNGGWQWAASVGCDAQPYFRIFNPYLQSQKFDPNGDFIRTWLPELASLEGDSIHRPAPFDCLRSGYPLPIVDHDEMRKQAIALFESARKV